MDVSSSIPPTIPFLEISWPQFYLDIVVLSTSLLLVPFAAFVGQPLFYVLSHPFDSKCSSDVLYFSNDNQK